MASHTKVTKFRRNLRRKKLGKKRKQQLRNEGTTPKFPLHTAEAHESAPKDQLPNKGEA